MADKLDCGHTSEEHADEGRSLQEAVAKGDLSPLVPSLTNENLMAILQMATVEMFVRAEDDTTAEHNWSKHDNLVRSTFMVNSAADSEWPEYYEMMIAQRAKFAADLEEGRSPGGTIPRPTEEPPEEYTPGGYM